MSVDLFPNDRFGAEDKYDNFKDAVKECSWLIEEIVKPQLPNIIDNFSKCLEMLESDQIFKMPVSNGIPNESNKQNDSPTVKGVITRQGQYIVDFHIVVRFPQFQRGKQVMFRMNTGLNFLLIQFSKIMTHLKNILEILNQLQVATDVSEFVSKFGVAMELLNHSLILLQNPPRDLVFPEDNNFAMKEMFQDCYSVCESTAHILGLELTLCRNELCIELRNLIKVTKKPWCEIDSKTGRSFCDQIRNQVTNERNKTLSKILSENGVQVQGSTLLNHIISSFQSEAITLPEAQELLRRGVTFDNRVVMECEKLIVSTSDPTLISISAKLNSLKASMANHQANLVASKQLSTYK
ncbi:CNT_collapsed_G0010870.mRNA.1.CDS.1 [Saccharomyces cerevisiae]|nr:CNT_HP2_G0010430.mRNA.1.CDS.1 [Saccharomyces cerevisiae]CAI6429079.1 CNT_HP1_G0009200.mRNA.1.CDS.1 [Saccharomyces cerevisiae]CAI6437867.1 CNT_HP2_G0010430.mRNA.1.CDS.1 [Saccharomyces cerevisiae]CAI7210917.1 CNT_collapsed_G0010870.mRNA.1.CDS.1 [Saccharomyces cerevisiae]